MCAGGINMKEPHMETGEGRSDICLYAKHDRYPNLILEFKYTKDEKDDLEKLAEKALEQIKEKQYEMVKID